MKVLTGIVFVLSSLVIMGDGISLWGYLLAFVGLYFSYKMFESYEIEKRN